MSSAAPVADVRSELSVSGMSCDNCVRHVHEGLTEIPGVRAEVDLDAATVTVEHPASVDPAQLVDAVVEAGYGATVRDTRSR